MHDHQARFAGLLSINCSQISAEIVSCEMQPEFFAALQFLLACGTISLIGCSLLNLRNQALQSRSSPVHVPDIHKSAD